MRIGLYNSDFFKKVLTLMAGTSIAQAIPIAISPILTRIYTPADFGMYAIFIALLTVLGSIANARYELAILLPEEDDDAYAIMTLGFFINLVITITLFVIVGIWGGHVSEKLGDPEIAKWLFLLPIAVFATGIINILNYHRLRKECYSTIAKSHIFKSLSMASTQVASGLIKFNILGLILGHLIGLLVQVALLMPKLTNASAFMGLVKTSFKKVNLVGCRHIKFPLYSAPAIFVNTSATHVVNLLIATAYNVSTLGYYSMVQKILGVPATLIGNAIRDVFFRQANENKTSQETMSHLFRSVVYKLLISGLIFFGFLFFSSELLFGFVFGEDWVIAGAYAKILIPFFLIRFVAAPVSILLTVYEKQKTALIWQVFFLIVNLFVVLVCIVLSIEFSVFLVGVSVTNIFSYLVLLYLSYAVIGDKIKFET